MQLAGVAPVFARFLSGMVRKSSSFLKIGGQTDVTVESGVQDVTVIVRGEYRPSVVQVVRGVPVRMRFVREEDEPCSGRVIFSGFGIDRRLLPFSETLIEFVPETVGEFLFTCEMGMYRGWLIVVPGVSISRDQANFSSRRKSRRQQ